MNVNNNVYITDIMTFKSSAAKSKPIFVNGRNFYSLTYRHSGKISLIYAQNELISSEDCVTYVPKNTSYTTEVLEDVSMTAIHFDIVGEGLPDTPMVIPINDTAVRNLFISLSQKSNDSTAHFSQMATVYRIFSELEKIVLTDSSKAVPNKIARAKEMIESKFAESLFSIESLAESIKVSPAYLRREFKSSYGLSPIKYLKDTRISNAKQLLLSGNMPVSEIAELCGYTSVSYFIQDFHRSLGESPNQYRTRLSVTP